MRELRRNKQHVENKKSKNKHKQIRARKNTYDKIRTNKKRKQIKKHTHKKNKKH